MRNAIGRILLATVAVAGVCRAADYGLDTLDLSQLQQDWGEARANKSVDGKPLLFGGKRFDHGVGTHAASTLRIGVGGTAERFTATVGVDDEVGGSWQRDVQVDRRRQGALGKWRPARHGSRPGSQR